ncbi:DUF2148 domain-containing protein [Candidatus Bathyarchaeota archaeon]|jgi:uncharacterized ferredoxin-like protein|nr:DUF2148 domain-containing protein [Candidatus Bathyarchaeota archaeon]
MIIDSGKAEAEAALYVAKLMMVAARTAPKAAGEDRIKTAIVTEEDKIRLSDKMEEIGQARNSFGLSRDAKNVRDSEAVVLIGVELGDPSSYLAFRAKLIDLGIAIGSAVKIASDLNVDNRVMHSIGQAATELGLLEADEVHGIPIAIKGKNIFFDRPRQT